MVTPDKSIQTKPAALLLSGILLLFGITSYSTAAGAAKTKFDEYVNIGERAYAARQWQQAEEAFRMALKLSERGAPSLKRLSTTTYNVGVVLQLQEKYEPALEFYQKALSLMDEAYGANNERSGIILGNMAEVYKALEQDTKALEYYKRSLETLEIALKQAGANEKMPAKQNPKAKQDNASQKQTEITDLKREITLDIANANKSLADFYAEHNQYNEAEPHYQKCLALEHQQLGQSSPTLGKHLAQIAEFYCLQGKYQEAEPLFSEAVECLSLSLGKEHPQTANVIYNFGGLYYDRGGKADFSLAEEKFAQAISILENNSPKNEFDLAAKKLALADALDMQSKNEEAEKVYVSAIAVLDKDPDPTQLINCLRGYQKHLLLMNKKQEALAIGQRLKELRTKRTSD